MGPKMPLKRALCLGMWAVSLLSCAPEAPRPEGGDLEAAPLYRGLNGRFRQLPEIVRHAFDGDSTDAAALGAQVDAYAPQLEELARASRAARCTWTYPQPPSLSDEYPLDYVLSAARLLVVRSRIRIHEGRIPAALEDLITLSRFGSDLTQDRRMIGRLLGLICHAWGCFEFRDWIRDGRLGRSALERAREHYDLILSRYPRFQTWLRWDKELGLPLLEELRDEGIREVIRRVAKESPGKEESEPIVELWEGWIRATLRRDFERTKERISARWDELLVPLEAELSLPQNERKLSFRLEEMRQGSRALAERMARSALGAGSGEEQALKDVADLLFMLWVPALDKVTLNHAKVRVLLEIAALGCRLELHRLDAGVYPDELGELTREPDDPFVNAKLRYRRIVQPGGEGYAVASAGPRGDAASRIRLLADTCGLDMDLFEQKSEREAENYTFGVFRRRN